MLKYPGRPTFNLDQILNQTKRQARTRCSASGWLFSVWGAIERTGWG